MNTRAATSSSSRASVGSHAVRFGLSFLLAIGPLAAVMAGFVPHEVRLPAILLLCVGHLLMQLVWFFHPGTRRDQSANTANFVCSGVLMAILLANPL